MPTILLERNVRDALTNQDLDGGWSQLASSLSDLCDEPSVSAGLVAGVAALQQACLDLGEAYQLHNPSYLQALESCCRIEAVVDNALGMVAAEWNTEETAAPIVTALLLGASAR